MTPSHFSTAWKRSTSPRKQRKYGYHAPLHLRQKKLHVHVAKALREKYGWRQLMVRKGDTVQVLRGQFTKKEAKVEKVLLKKERLALNGIGVVKRDGSKVPYHFHPSTLQIVQLDLGDQRRRKKIESKFGKSATEKIKKK